MRCQGELSGLSVSVSVSARGEGQDEGEARGKEGTRKENRRASAGLEARSRYPGNFPAI